MRILPLTEGVLSCHGCCAHQVLSCQACMCMSGKAAGVEAVRVDAYETRPGSTQAGCAPERRMLAEGSIHALAFTSTAEVG